MAQIYFVIEEEKKANPKAIQDIIDHYQEVFIEPKGMPHLLDSMIIKSH